MRETRLKTTVIGFRQRTVMVNFTGISLVWFRRRITMLGRLTSCVGGICGLQTKSDIYELLKENDRGGIQT